MQGVRSAGRHPPRKNPADKRAGRFSAAFDAPGPPHESASLNSFERPCLHKFYEIYFLYIETQQTWYGMKKCLFLIGLALSILSVRALAGGKFTYTSYYPIPHVELKQFLLVPQPEDRFGTSPILGTACTTPGRIFFNEDELRLYFCGKKMFPPDDSFLWTYPPGIWQQQDNILFLSPTDDNENTFIGVGVPSTLTSEKLTLAYDGGILATGDFGGSFNNLWTSGTGTRFIWYPEEAALRAGGIIQDAVDLTGSYMDYDPNNDGLFPFVPGWINGEIRNYSMAFGINNEARAQESGILGGEYSIIESSASNSVILNSSLNTYITGPTEDSDYSTSAGGNIIDSKYAFAGGANIHEIAGTTHNLRAVTLIDSSDYAAVLNSGFIINSPCSFIGSALPNPDPAYNPAYATPVIGDLNNDFGATISSNSCSSGRDTTHGTILGAYGIMNCSPHGFIGSGSQHRMNESEAAVILGGKQNTVEGGDYSVLLGGENNHAGGDDAHLTGSMMDPATFIPGPYQFLGAGKNNRVHTSYSIVMGGENNHAGTVKYRSDNIHITHSVVAGGLDNTSNGFHSFIGGGRENLVGSGVPQDTPECGRCSVVLGGDHNISRSKYTVIGGGFQNSAVFSEFSVIEGGQDNRLDTNHSWLFGEGNSITLGTVGADNLWLFGFDEDFANYQSGKFIISDSGLGDIRVGIQTMDPQAHLDVNGDAQSETLVISSASTVTGSGLRVLQSSGQIGRQDLAEVFTASEKVSPGDVVVMDPDAPEIILLKGRKPYDPMLVGVVSTAPAMVLDNGTISSDFQNVPNTTLNPPVALSGQVPCKVSLENGAILPGDLLTTSSTSGHAMKAIDPYKSFGSIVGKALEPFNKTVSNEEETGTINILVSLQ